METFVQLIMFSFSLVCLIIFFVMASNISKLAKTSKNSERILQRILELVKESSNETKIKQQQPVRSSAPGE